METHLRIPSLGDLRIFEHYGAIIVVEALAAMLLFLLSGGVTGGRRAIRPVTAAFIAAIIASIPLAASYQELVMNREWHTATSAEAEAFESSHPKQSLVTAPSSVLADVAAAVQRDRGKALLFSDSHLLLPHSRWHVFALLSVFPVVYGLAFTLAATVFPFWSPFLAPPPA